MRLLFGLTVIALTVACGTSKVSRDRYKDLHVIYGLGGGFTGAIEQYEVNSKGDLYRISIPGDTTYLGRLSHTQKRYLRSLIQADSLNKISYNNYANMTSFLYIKVKDDTYIKEFFK